MGQRPAMTNVNSGGQARQLSISRASRLVLAAKPAGAAAGRSRSADRARGRAFCCLSDWYWSLRSPSSASTAFFRASHSWASSGCLAARASSARRSSSPEDSARAVIRSSTRLRAASQSATPCGSSAASLPAVRNPRRASARDRRCRCWPTRAEGTAEPAPRDPAAPPGPDCAAPRSAWRTVRTGNTRRAAARGRRAPAKIANLRLLACELRRPARCTPGPPKSMARCTQ
jgi:hypothetical protein